MYTQQNSQFTSSKEQMRRNEYPSQSQSKNNHCQRQLRNSSNRSPSETKYFNKSEHQNMLTTQNQYNTYENLSRKQQKRNNLSFLLDSKTPKTLRSYSPNSPFVSPVIKQHKRRENPLSLVYFGYQEYEYTNIQGYKEYTTIYYFKYIDQKNPNKDYFHEIVTQACLKKFYFSVMLKKLIGFLQLNNSNRSFDIISNSVYYDRLIQVTDRYYQPQTPSQKRSYENLLQTIKKYQNSKLKFSISKTDQNVISQMYLGQKDFPCQSFSSIRIPNQFSTHESEDFLSTDQFNNYLGKELKDLCQNNNNNIKQIKNEIFQFNGPLSQEEEVEQEILPYYCSPSGRDSSRSRSRSPIKCVRYD
ncbi:hypothetical protein ABPG74_018137 [Tetrahymena malaccensis]